MTTASFLKELIDIGETGRQRDEGVFSNSNLGNAFQRQKMLMTVTLNCPLLSLVMMLFQ